MRDKTLFVTNSGETSPLHNHNSGIFHGGIASAPTFVILMSILMHDALNMLQGNARQAFEQWDLADVVYAADTVLIAVSNLIQFTFDGVYAGAAGRK